MAVAQQLGGPRTVYIARDPSAVTAVYPEIVLVPNNVSLSGGWLRSATGVWTLDVPNNVTSINAPDNAGVVVLSGATRSTVTLSGLTINGAGTANSVALTLQSNASPTLTQLTVNGGNNSMTSTGLLVGQGSNPVISQSSVLAGSGTTSVAVTVDTATAEIHSSKLQGGSGVSFSVGLNCPNGCAGLTVADGTSIRGGVAQQSAGAHLSGDVNGISITDSTLTGGPAGTSLIGQSRGALVVESCPAITLTNQMVSVT